MRWIAVRRKIVFLIVNAEHVLKSRPMISLGHVAKVVRLEMAIKHIGNVLSIMPVLLSTELVVHVMMLKINYPLVWAFR